MRNGLLEKIRTPKIFLKGLIVIFAVACLMGLLAEEALAVEPVEFFPEQVYNLPAETYDQPDIVDVLTADFDGDGYCDIVACGDYGERTVTGRVSFIVFLFNQGDGTFYDPVLYEMPSNGVRNMALGDFNEDGKPDLAVVDYRESGVRVLLNQGDGIFDPSLSVHYSTGDGREYYGFTWTVPAAVVASDLNQDEHLDLAVSNDSEGKLCFLMGDGSGSFTSGSDNFDDISLGVQAYNMIAHDLFRFHGWDDGYPDLAMVCSDHKVRILKNTAGIIDDPIIIETSETGEEGLLYDIVAGQFDYDTGHDIIVGNYSDPNHKLNIIVKHHSNDYLSVKGIEFTNVTGIHSGTTAFAVGDFNDDGKPDVVRQIDVASFKGMQIMLGLPRELGYVAGFHNVKFQEGGKLQFPSSLGGRPVCTAVGDFDNNGRSDVVTGYDMSYHQIHVRLTKYLLPLTDLTVNPGSLEPAFDPETFSYHVEVPHSAAELELMTTMTDDPSCKLTINGQERPAGTVTTTVPLDPGENTIEVFVDGCPDLAYQVQVTRPKPSVNPATGSFDKNPDFQTDVETTLTWNSASAVTDITTEGTSIGADNYIITDIDGDPATLRIYKEYLAIQPTGSLVLAIAFDTGETAEITIDISDSTPPFISPVSAYYDLNTPADVTTTITWNSASTVTDVVYSTAGLNLDTDYIVTGDILTIKNSFLSGLTPSEGEELDFDISFDTGSPATLTIHVVKNHIPFSDANLSDLTVGGVTIKDFDADITAYAVKLPHTATPGCAAAWVGATANDPAARVSITQASALPGSSTVTVSAEDGTTTKPYTIYFTTEAAPFVPVVNITGVPATATAGTPLALNGTIVPTNATNKTIVWSLLDGGSTGAAVSGNTLSAAAAGTVTIRATIVNGVSESEDFTQDFTITVNEAPVTTYTVTFNNRGSVYATRTVNDGGSIGSGSWPSNPTRSGYTFGGWYTGTNGTGTKFTADTTINANITVYAKWTSKGGSSSGRRSTSSAPAAPKYQADVKPENGNKIAVPVTVEKDTGTVFIDTKNIFQSGTTVTMPTIPGVKNYAIGMPVAYLSTPDGGMLTFNTDNGTLMLPADMLSGVPESEGKTAEITIGIGVKSNLSSDMQEAIGDRPLISLSLTLDGEVTPWSNPDTPVTVSIPYTPTEEELADPEHIVIWYIDGSGNVVSVPSGRYDPDTGTVTFSTTHFSRFAVAFVTKTFDDLKDVSWAKKPIEVLASKGILTGIMGISETEYAPGRDITRADFLYFLIKTLDVDAVVDGNFEDISHDAYYEKEIAIAKKLGITNGTGNNRFSPDESITRQDMMVLTGRALRMLNKLEVKGTASDLDRFADKSLVADYAVDSVASLVKEELIKGDGARIHPLGNTTRAEAAVFLYRIYNIND